MKKGIRLLRCVVVLGLLATACASPPTPRGVAATDPPLPPPVPATAAPATRIPPVAAPKRPVTHTYFGTAVTDDYEWLENGESPEVHAFIDAQNALARKTLDSFSERAAIRAKVAAILDAPSPDWSNLAFEGGHLFALESAPPKQQRLLVDLGSSPASPKERVVLDPNVLDPAGKTTIDFFVPSPDGRAVLVSLSKDGSEDGDLHVFDVASGKERGEAIAHVHGGTAGGSAAWNADGTGFFYTRYPRSGERPPADLPFYQQVYFHKVGANESTDTYAIGKDFPKIAEVELLRSVDGKHVLANVSNGDGGDAEQHVFDGHQWRRLTHFEDEVSSATFGPDGRVYAVSRKKAPRGKVIAFAPPFDGAVPVDIVPEGDAVISDVLVTKTSVYTVEVEDGPSRMRRFPTTMKSEPLAREPKPPPKPAKKGAKKEIRKEPPVPEPPPTTIPPGARGYAAAVLPIPPVSSIQGAIRFGDDLLVRLESYVEAPRWMIYRASEHRLVATALSKKASFDMSDVDVVRESCVSKDGTKVPMSILHRRGVKLDGSMPAYVTGYGGFGISIKPRMRGAYRVWLDSGGLVAETNLRGGNERGEAWHRAGNLTNKQNVFDDFAACAKTLVDRGYTRPERLAISGRSNGGLLMGASLVQHPEMFRAVAATVGIYDMLRTELGSNGAFNVTEYGSVTDEAQFKALRAYSPLHNVKDGTAYPAVLFMTGANDPRVDPYQSRKMVARLQAATASDRPILLRASSDTGHGMGTPLAAEIEETTDLLTFLLHEVGASPPTR